MYAITAAVVSMVIVYAINRLLTSDEEKTAKTLDEVEKGLDRIGERIEALKNEVAQQNNWLSRNIIDLVSLPKEEYIYSDYPDSDIQCVTCGDSGARFTLRGGKDAQGSIDFIHHLIREAVSTGKVSEELLQQVRDRELLDTYRVPYELDLRIAGILKLASIMQPANIIYREHSFPICEMETERM